MHGRLTLRTLRHFEVVRWQRRLGPGCQRCGDLFGLTHAPGLTRGDQVGRTGGWQYGIAASRTTALRRFGAPALAFGKERLEGIGDLPAGHRRHLRDR